MNPEIQEKRYNHKEERKKMKIKEGIERRKEMIENPDKIFSKVKKNIKKYLKMIRQKFMIREYLLL